MKSSDIILHVAHSIQKSPVPSWNVATGTTGLALFYLALDRCTGHWQNPMEDMLAETFSQLDMNDCCEVGLFSGLAGVCQTVSFVSQFIPEYLLLKHELDAHLFSLVERLYPLSPSLEKGVSFRDYDVISGPAGIGSYLLSVCLNSPSDASHASLQTVLRRLIYLSGPSSLYPGHLRLFIPPDRAPHQAFAANYPYGATDCGLAHGIPGVLAFLALCALHEKTVDGLHEALVTLAGWLVSKYHEDSHHIHWPLIVPFAGPSKLEGSVWCYGASGIAWSLWLAGLACKEDVWQELAIRTMSHLSQEILQGQSIANPMLCHGLAGILQVVLGFLSMTADSYLSRFRNLLIRRIRDCFDHTLPGFWANRQEGKELTGQTLLEGSSGVALALLAADSSNPFLKKMLFPFFLLTEDPARVGRRRDTHEETHTCS